MVFLIVESWFGLALILLDFCYFIAIASVDLLGRGGWGHLRIYPYSYPWLSYLIVSRFLPLEPGLVLYWFCLIFSIFFAIASVDLVWGDPMAEVEISFGLALILLDFSYFNPYRILIVSLFLFFWLLHRSKSGLVSPWFCLIFPILILMVETWLGLALILLDFSYFLAIASVEIWFGLGLILLDFSYFFCYLT